MIAGMVTDLHIRNHLCCHAGLALHPKRTYIHVMALTIVTLSLLT